MIGDSRLPQLSARRWYAAPPDLVFRALTEAALLQRWLRPSPEVTVEVTELDVRVGGRYRFHFHFPDHRTGVVIGEYRAIARPHQVAFTWTWEPPDPHAGIDTLVTIDLDEKNGGTELFLTHAGFPTEETMRRHEGGWDGALDSLSGLADILSQEAGASG
jgi:uncharacterized protein YndB with AHSA1/START domain